jgi:hypothetical protein
MVTKQKIEEAEYFLDKITKAMTRNDFIPNLSAFLSATRSIPDYLLEDYNTKLGLNISLTEKLHIETFLHESISQSNQIAQEFIKEYKTQLNNIYNDPIGKLLTIKRNISIHRTGILVQGSFKRGIHETINISDSVSFVVTDGHGNIKKRSEPNSEEKPEPQKTEEKLSQSTDSVEWYFDDYKEYNVVSTCHKFLNLVKAFVTSITIKFP